MRAFMLLGILVLAACGEDTGSRGTGGQEPAPARAGEASPPAVPPPAGRSIVRTDRGRTIEGTHPDASWLIELAQQRAAECYAQTPSRQGSIDVVIEIAPDGHIASVTSSRDEVELPAVFTCIEEAIGRLHVRPREGPATRITASWRFEVIHDIDHERDCASDRDCGLASGVCEGPLAARRAIIDSIDTRHREEASRARCASPAIVPVRARCIEGYCTAVPADMPELRGCGAASECTLIERRCGWDAVASAHLADAQAITLAEREGLLCDPRPDRPTVQCAAGFCTADWAPSAPP